MKLILQRLKPTSYSTPGDIFGELGEKICCSHEEGTIFTPGTYQLKNGYSARMSMWITNIFSSCGQHHVGFIHPGKPHQLAGSHIILGEERRLDLIVDSRAAFKRLFEMIDDSKKSFDEMVTLQIRNHE